MNGTPDNVITRWWNAREQYRRQILRSPILTDDMKKRALVSLGGGEPLIALQFNDVQIRVNFTAGDNAPYSVINHRNGTTTIITHTPPIDDEEEDLWTPD